MTCREFKNQIASFGLGELMRSAAPAHAESCPACAAWLEKQRSLAASLQALRAQTSGQEAGADVERALVRVFRQGVSAGVLRPPAGAEGAAGVPDPAEAARSASLRLKPAPASTPFAWRLSRLFEIGAYVAAAAAIAVAIFLGVYLMGHGSNPPVVQGQSQRGPSAPQQAQVVATGTGASNAAPGTAKRKRIRGNAGGAEVNSDESQTTVEASYTPLMICDPLSCSTETQVVRMELPGSAGAEPQLADVVVGYDGVVRAVRLVE